MTRETGPHKILHQSMTLTIIEEFDVKEQDLIPLFSEAARLYSQKYPIEHELAPYKILVVCDENQGRSQIGAKFLEKMAQAFGLNIPVKSAGLNATPEKYEGKPVPDVIRHMETLGFDMSDTTVDQLKEIDIDNQTLLIVMTESALPNYALNAFMVLVAKYDDIFPGDIRPPDLTNRLTGLMNKAAYFSFEFMLYFYESLRQSDFTILSEFFNKKRSKKILHKRKMG